MRVLRSHASVTPITVRRLQWTELVDLLASGVRRNELGGPEGELLVVGRPTRAPEPATQVALAEAVAALPVVVAVEADGRGASPGTGETSGEVGAEAIVDLAVDDPVLDLAVDDPVLDLAVERVADVVVDPGATAAVVDRFEQAPVACTALALLLRHHAGRSVADGLVAESAVYSTLQAGPEFATWQLRRPRRSHPEPAPDATPEVDAPRVQVARHGDELVVTLDRPAVRNALDAAMRDELWDAFAVAVADPGLSVRWRGSGGSFCAGGDLDEFGSRSDPAHAHLIRLTRSLGRVVHDLADRTTVELHGACVGSGIELPAFAGRVVATPDTTISLPEPAFGLIPGAGGTVSLPRRIGRHRTAWLALTGASLDAATARSWGLVDEIVAAHPDPR